MSFDPMTDLVADFIISWSLNIAVLAGAWWVMLRCLEQLHKVWHLYKEEEK